MKRKKLLFLLLVFISVFGFKSSVKAANGIVCSYSGYRWGGTPTAGTPQGRPFVFTVKVKCKDKSCKNVSVSSYGAIESTGSGFHDISVPNSGDIASMTKDKKSDFGNNYSKCPSNVGFEGRGFSEYGGNDYLVLTGDDSQDANSLSKFGKFSYSLSNASLKSSTPLASDKDVDIKEATRSVLEGEKPQAIEPGGEGKTVDVDNEKEREKKKEQEEGGKNSELVDKIKKATKDKWVQEDEYGTTTCTGLIGTDNIKIIRNILFYLAVAGVIIVIATGAADFVKAIARVDDDGIKKAAKNVKVRIISVILLLLMPFLVDFGLSIINRNVIMKEVNKKGESASQKEIQIKIGKIEDCFN